MTYGKAVGGRKESPGPEDETKSLGPIYPSVPVRQSPMVTRPSSLAGTPLFLSEEREWDDEDIAALQILRRNGGY